MKKNKAQKDILYIAISSFILVVLWIGFNLYHAHATSTIEPVLQLQIKPIDPSFDTAVIQKLKSRQNIQPVYELNNASSTASISPTPTAQETSTSTNSGELTISEGGTTAPPANPAVIPVP
jgi:hypothetical protein